MGMIVTMLALTLQATPSPSAPQPTKPADRDIVVTGRPLDQTEQALKACIARRCPPDQDVAASLAHAENQFVSGSYHEARRTLLEAVGRDKRFAKEYPVPVSDLLRAGARVSIHVGEGDAYLLGMIDSLSALKAGLADDDSRVLAQKIELADAYAHLGRETEALRLYRGVAHQSRALGRPTLEGHALFRTAMLYGVLAEVDPVYRSSARRSIAAITSTTDPALEPFRNAVKLLQARLADKEGDHEAIDRLIASYHLEPSARPMLLYSPPIKDQSNERSRQSGSTTSRIATEDFDGQWVDVSFWIAPDGSVSDAGILRQSAGLDPAWVKPVLESVSGRRYAPSSAAADTPGLLRVERYTRTSLLETQTNSRLRVHSAKGRIEVLDLTAEPPPKTAG